MFTLTNLNGEAQRVPPAPLEALWEVYPMTLSRLKDAEALHLVQDFYRWRRAQGTRGTLARQFPLFIADRKWPAADGFLPILAEAEWHIWNIQQEPEVPNSGFERVKTATDEDWAGARFQFDPGHRLLDSDWCLNEIMRNLDGEHERRPGKYLIFRSKGRPKLKPLKQNEAELIEALDLGVPLGVIQERANGPDFDAFLFHNWIDTGFLRAIHWSTPAAINEDGLPPDQL
jgi:hypothetical protein